MGPIPSLPSSQSIAPLAPLFPTHAIPQTRPDSAESRPVGLPTDQVLPVSDEAGSRETRDVARNPSEVAPQTAKEKRQKENQEEERVEVENPRIEPQHRSVTYKVHPDLQRALQGNVIDADTSEVLKEIPSEERIQLSKALRAQVGSTLDTFA